MQERPERALFPSPTRGQGGDSPLSRPTGPFQTGLLRREFFLIVNGKQPPCNSWFCFVELNRGRSIPLSLWQFFFFNIGGHFSMALHSLTPRTLTPREKNVVISQAVYTVAACLTPRFSLPRELAATQVANPALGWAFWPPWPVPICTSLIWLRLLKCFPNYRHSSATIRILPMSPHRENTVIFFNKENIVNKENIFIFIYFL